MIRRIAEGKILLFDGSVMNYDVLIVPAEKTLNTMRQFLRKESDSDDEEKSR